MNWSNNELIQFILSRSLQENDYLRKPELTIPEDNPLWDDSVSLKELEFALEIRDYIGDIPLDDETNYISKSARVMIAGSSVNHIDLDEYEEEDIEEYRNYLIERKEIFDFNRGIPFDNIDKIPVFSCVHNISNDKDILILSNNVFNPLSVGVNEFERLVNEIPVATRYYRRMSEDDILDYIRDVDFVSLRKRLIDAGYENLVSYIDSELADHFVY